MKNRMARAAQRLQRPRDQVLPALAEDLDGDAGRNTFFFDEPTAKIELDLRSGRKADLDFLEADLHQQVEVLEFFIDTHRLRERLVAVPEVDGAPDGRMGERAVGPLSVWQVDGRKRTVLQNGRRLHDS